MILDAIETIDRAKSSPVVARNIPSIADVERKLFFTNLPEQLDAELESLVDKVSLEVFGVTRADTTFRFPDHYDNLSADCDERWQIDDDYEEHEADYVTADFGDDDTIIFLLALGLDFRDNNGYPLLCTRYFKRQAEIAAKGKLGRLPDIAKINDDIWEQAATAKWKREAEMFRQKKDRG